MFEMAEQRPSIFKQMRQAVARTHEGWSERMVAPVRAGDRRFYEELETVLLTSDMSRETVDHLLAALAERARRKAVKGEENLRDLLKDYLLEVLTAPAEGRIQTRPRTGDPFVTILVGPNGTGKTTTSGKLAAWNRGRRRSVMLCAADTYRPAAIEQLDDWARRAGAEIVKGRTGDNPTALVFEAAGHARESRFDELIVDTAGRLHTKADLMQELDNLIHAAAQVVPYAPHEVLLVMDATTGQNGLQQARRYVESAGVTGIVLTKLDGTARCGIAVTIALELNLPVRYMGVGEQMDDFLEFFPEAFIDTLLEPETAVN